MRIKQLELIGFKSFVDRTVLTFAGGISAIVGPNGCGKSNVVDSIRWALGEQSPKHLRGSAMEDVIFKGNERRSPLGMAEVSITFENDPESAAIESDPELDVSTVPAHIRGLSEITVTRRYYRSGESEYLINRTACRLKDITELFLGTGVGSKAYAIIEQGRVEQLINAKPEDRRWFIEEAAGTTLYRSRKQAAERKMERTRENLLRVNDILREVERQIQYLHRQAKKAEQYRSLQGEIRCLELCLAVAQWRTLTAEIAALEESVTGLHEDEERLLAELHRADEERLAAHGRADESARELSAARESAARAKAESETHRQRAAWLQQQISERQQRIERLARDVESLRRQAVDVGREGEEVSREREAYVQQLASEEIELRERGDAVERHRAISSAAEAGAEEIKDKLVGVLARQAEGRNQSLSLRRREEDAGRRLERLSAERAQAAEQLRLSEEELVRQREALGVVRRRLRDLAGEREGHSARLRQLSEQRSAAEQEASGAHRELLQIRSRLESLEEIQRNYEGYQRGVRSIMVAQQPAEGVLGVVADVIAAPREYERAVAAVLGDRLQYMIVSGEDQALGAVQVLRSEESGRASFIPQSPRRISLNGDRQISSGGTSARLLDLIRVQEGYKDVAELLLGDVLLVPDLRTALSLWRRNGIHVTMVTPEGDVLDAHGVISGGSERPIEEEILGRRREIEELEMAIADAAGRYERSTAEVSRLGAAQATEDAALRELDSGVHDLTLKAIAVEKDCERLEADLPRSHERLEVVGLEIDAARGEREEARRENEGLSAMLVELDTQHAELERSLQAQQQECARLRDETRALAESLTGARVGFAERKERHLALVSRFDELLRQRDDLTRRIDQVEAERAETSLRHEALLGEVRGAEEAVAEAESRDRVLGVEIDAAATRVEAAREAALRQDQCVEELRQSIDERRSDRVSRETTLAEQRVRLEHLEQGVREKHGTELAAEVEGGAIEPPDESTAARLSQLRERLARIGEVNVGAIEELQELEERAQFLRAQKEDLERSLADLERTITKLNRASRTRFQEAFQQVDEKFRTVFPRLFRGGEAHLVLTDEHNLLESGVEIFVRPPGKKLDTVSLLSGGEKALVAVSLIFSLFMIAPTPFCFLDEVDAPLDDANVGRFVQMVREMREHSQFIMITHNKRTMEAADCLYGVTMEEPGVSKVISVAMR